MIAVSGGTRCVSAQTEGGNRKLAGQAAEKLAFVHAVLEGFASVDEHDGNLVVELAAKLDIRVYIDFFPRESATASELCEALFHQLAKMTTFA